MQYQRIFPSYSTERKRIDGILDGWGDMYPGTCNHPEVEACLVALAEGKPAPYDLSGKKRSKRAKTRMDQLPEPDIIAPVVRALQELFANQGA